MSKQRAGVTREETIRRVRHLLEFWLPTLNRPHSIRTRETCLAQLRGTDGVGSADIIDGQLRVVLHLDLCDAVITGVVSV